MPREPARLRRGKKFHKTVQSRWLQETAGTIHRERSVVKPSGQRGRIDVYAADEGNHAAVLEIKATGWDRIRQQNVRRNALRHARQIWSYIDGVLEEGKTVSPGIAYPRTPRRHGLREQVEALMEDRGIAVVWEDETVAERRARSGLGEA